MAIQSTRRFVPAAFIAAAAALGAIAFGGLGPASAEPFWDVGAFQDCIDNSIINGWSLEDDEARNEVMRCCFESGGVWNEAKGECGAPPLEVQRTPPPRVVPSAEISAPLS